MGTIGAKRFSEVTLAQDQDMIEEFSTNTAEETFANRVAIGRLRSWFENLGSNTFGCTIEHASEFAVTVSDEKSGSSVEWSRVTELLSRPLIRRMARHVEVNDLPILMPNDG